MENSSKFEDDETFNPPTPEMDLDEVSAAVEDSLNTAKELANRLGEVNQEMVEYLTNYANSKASVK